MLPSMLVTLVGIVTLVRLVQDENAASPMVLTVLGITTLVSLAVTVQVLEAKNTWSYGVTQG